jgi:hypothetical protein
VKLRTLILNYVPSLFIEIKGVFPRAAWRSGHRIRLKNRRSGFESRQGVDSFFLEKKQGNSAEKVELILIV